jgi:hypothetical protein
MGDRGIRVGLGVAAHLPWLRSGFLLPGAALVERALR